MPVSSVFSTSFLPMPAKVCPLPLHLLCLCLPKFVYFFCVYSFCAWSLSALSASALSMPVRVCPFYVCFAYAWSLSAFFMFALFVSAGVYPLPLRLLHLCLYLFCPLFLRLLYLCLCLVCPLSAALFFLYCVTAVGLFFEFYNISLN